MDYYIANSKQLAQVAGSGSNALLLTPIDKSRLLVYSIILTNTSGSAVDTSLYHDNDGTTYSSATALLLDYSIPANDYLKLNFDSLAPLPLIDGAALGCKGSGITFTVYGIEINSQGQA